MNDYTYLALQRTAFMESPPACSAVVRYRAANVYTNHTNADFLFRSANVNKIALLLEQENSQLVGMNATALWTSLRNKLLLTPTDVPEILVSFDHIAHELIEAKHGQVFCHACNKYYATAELEQKSEWYGSWIIDNYLCPARHSLFNFKVAHFMFKRNYE